MNRILLATMSLGIGGAETHILELALELRRRGIDVHVASNGGVYVSSLEDAGIVHHQIPMHRRSVPSMLKSLLLMRRLIKREKPDIVHAHARIPGFICGLLSKLMRFSFVTTAHFDFETGHGLRYFTNWGKKAIAVSDDIKDYLVSNYNLIPDDVIVTVNAVDTERFSPDVSPSAFIGQYGLDSSVATICYVSRLDDNAALSARLVIGIAPELHSRIPGIRIVIVGDGSIYDELNAAAAEANSIIGSNSVILTGMRTDVEEVLAAADLFVGVSRSALEALSVGVPVVLAGNEGYLGLFTPEKLAPAKATNFTCRECGQATQELLLDEIVRFFTATSEDEKSQLSVFGRSLILADYSVKRLADDCQSVYEAAAKRPLSIVMSGYYGYKNAGDEAILQSVHQNISEVRDDVSITVLSSDPVDTKRNYGCNAVKRFRLFSVLKAIRNCDLLVSGGGSLLQDATSTRSLLYYLFIINAAKRRGKKVMLYSNGIGPVRKKGNRHRVARAVNRADIITLRDADSLEELREIGVVRDDIRVTADPVFSLRKPADDEIARVRAKYRLPDAPFLTVSIRDRPDTESFCETIASICDGVHERSGREILFISMQADKDDAVNRRVRAMMKSSSYIVEGRQTAEELMCIIGASDAVFGMRLHALIFAARMGVPYASLVYDPKVSAFTSATSMPSAGDVEKPDADLALEAILQLLERRDEYAEALSTKVTEFELAVTEDTSLLLGLLAR